jgi:hypothetical protein
MASPSDLSALQLVSFRVPKPLLTSGGEAGACCNADTLDVDMMLVYSLLMPTNLVGKMVNRPGGMLL